MEGADDGAISGWIGNYICNPWKDGELGGGDDGAISGWIGNYQCPMENG